MNNTPPPTIGLSQDAIEARAKRELAGLRIKLGIALEERGRVDRQRINAILGEMRRVYARARLSGQVSGMLTPWAQHLNKEVPRDGKPASLPPVIRTMSIWDTLEGSLNWLNQQLQSFPSNLSTMVQKAVAESAVDSVTVDIETLTKVQSELSESFRLGEGRDDWRKRVGDIVQLRAGRDEMIARTSTHQAYLSGQRQVLQEPVIRDLFPYRQYFATLDNRVRPEHAAMDRKVYHRDSTLARQAAALLDDYNCRCSETAMTEDDAIAIGVSPGGQPIGAPSLRAYVEVPVAA